MHWLNHTSLIYDYHAVLCLCIYRILRDLLNSNFVKMTFEIYFTGMKIELWRSCELISDRLNHFRPDHHRKLIIIGLTLLNWFWIYVKCMVPGVKIMNSEHFVQGTFYKVLCPRGWVQPPGSSLKSTLNWTLTSVSGLLNYSLKLEQQF